MIKLNKVIQIENYTFWVTSNRKIGISFATQQLDFELTNLNEFESQFSRYLKSLNEKVKFRVQLSGDDIMHTTPNHSRSEHLREIGESYNNLLLSFEMKIDYKVLITTNLDAALEKQARELLDYLNLSSLDKCGFNLRNIKEVDALFWDLNMPIVQNSTFLDSGVEKIGVIKLLKSSNNYVSLETMTQLQLAIPKPFEIHVSIRRIPDAITKLKFTHTAKRELLTNTTAGQSKSLAADQAAAGMELGGDRYFSFEWHLLLRRSSEEELKHDIKSVFNDLQGFSEFYIESIGAYPSFMSVQIASEFHINQTFENITEKDITLPSYLPLLTFGCKRKTLVAPSSFAFHRIDGSVDYFNNFSHEYNNANLNIIGQSGKGKSVLINRKIMADHFDQNTTQIIVDVKGSHTRLVRSLGGDVYNINLKTGSGINPVSFLEIDSAEKTLEIVKTFICELCLDDEEKKLGEIESCEIEEYLMNFVDKAKSGKLSYSIDDFISCVPDKFSRKLLLKRFSSKGMLKHIFAESISATEIKKNRNRLRYYNFQNIDTASNKAISRAIMAAIMADFSFTLSTKELSEKLIFVSDETPFFIKHCFRSFSLISKNVRALNGSLMLTVQVSANLVVDGDKSLIDSAVSNIFLSGDETETIFKDRFNLDDQEVHKIFNLAGEQGKYSQFLIKDVFGSRIGNLHLSKKEYWQATTKPSELDLINKLKKEFSDVSEDTIISLISEQNKNTSQAVKHA